MDKAANDNDQLSFEPLARANARVVMQLFSEFDNHQTKRGEQKRESEAQSNEHSRGYLAIR